MPPACNAHDRDRKSSRADLFVRKVRSIVCLLLVLPLLLVNSFFSFCKVYPTSPSRHPTRVANFTICKFHVAEVRNGPCYEKRCRLWSNSLCWEKITLWHWFYFPWREYLKLRYWMELRGKPVLFYLFNIIVYLMI